MFNVMPFLFALSVFQASYLIVRAFRPPNAEPKHTIKGDFMANSKYLYFQTAYSYALGSIGPIHAMFTLFPSVVENVCHSPSLNRDLFSWNRLTTPLILVSLFGGYLRVVAYMQLRENFTFRLVRPSQIVKTGIYAWVQHPSYSGAALLIFCYCGLVMPVDGVLSCWMGSIPLYGIVYANWVYLVWAVTVIFPLRITKEEKMLRDGFGKEWEDYNRQTARLVPYVF